MCINLCESLSRCAWYLLTFEKTKRVIRFALMLVPCLPVRTVLAGRKTLLGLVLVTVLTWSQQDHSRADDLHDWLDSLSLSFAGWTWGSGTAFIGS